MDCPTYFLPAFICLGKIGMVLNFEWTKPEDNSAENVEAAETARQFEFGWFAHPLILGDYPKIMKERIARRSAQEKFAESRLPTFDKYDLLAIKGSYDFLGVNHYSSFLVKAAPEADIGAPTFEKDKGTVKRQLSGWEDSALDYMKITPWGMRDMLVWLKQTYGDIPIWITECGYPDNGGLNDEKRIKYLKGYLTEMHNAIVKDKVNVKGFFVWSLMDNLEWGSGYKIKFGLFSVDFENPNRTRTPKQSAEYYSLVVKRNSLPGKATINSIISKIILIITMIISQLMH